MAYGIVNVPGVTITELNEVKTIANGLYTGKDLTMVFATEISKFSDPWAWVKNRIQNGNYAGINVGDYIPITINTETVEMQVAGVDVYTGATDNGLGHHIDFISRDCYDQTYWNGSEGSEDNNGNADNPHPYMACYLYRWLSELTTALPDGLLNQITPKRAKLETRYSKYTGPLNDSEVASWQDIGQLWVPSEYEVFGACVWGTKGYSVGSALQYPIFTKAENRIKRLGKDGDVCDWWLLNPTSGSHESACKVDRNGSPEGMNYTSSYCGVPICFRIA